MRRLVVFSMMVAGCRARDSVSPPPGALTPAPAMAAPTPDAPAPAEEAAAEAAAVGAPETPAAADAWVAEAVDEGLWAEIMPGTSAEPDPARAAQLRAFFVAHPRYRSADLRAELWDHACGLGGVEAAHQHLLEPPEQTPLVVDVSGDSWGVFVAHSSGYCTSDDWGYYAGEALEKAASMGAVAEYANPEKSVLVIRRGDEELHRIPLSDQGFVAARAGHPVRPMPYDPSVGRMVREYFGEPVPAP